MTRKFHFNERQMSAVKPMINDLRWLGANVLEARRNPAVSPGAMLGIMTISEAVTAASWKRVYQVTSLNEDMKLALNLQNAEEPVIEIEEEETRATPRPSRIPFGLN